MWLKVATLNGQVTNRDTFDPKCQMCGCVICNVHIMQASPLVSLKLTPIFRQAFIVGLWPTEGHC